MATFWAGPHHVDTFAREVKFGAHVVGLTETEAAMLDYLHRNVDRAVPKHELLREVWGYHESVKSRTVDTTLNRLRKKVEPDPREPEFLRSGRGRGITLTGVTDTRVDRLRVRVSFPVAPALVGRDPVVHDLEERLQRPGVVTLVGPGGMGKSAVALGLLDRWSNGLQSAVLVELVGASELTEVRAAFAAAVSGPGAPQDAPSIVESLRSLTHPLVVADSCEQLAPDALAWLATLGDYVPLLATSRRSLGLPGDDVRLPPLDRTAARELLEQRMREVGRRGQDAAVEAALDTADGIPLAVELLAPMVDLLGQDVARYVLDVEGEDARRPSLRAVLEQSWERLSPPARQVLEACAVFEHRFEMHALAAVAGAPLPVVLGACRELEERCWLLADAGWMQLYVPAREYVRQRSPADRGAALRAWLVKERATLVLGDPRLAREYRRELMREVDDPEVGEALRDIVFVGALLGGWIPEAIERFRRLLPTLEGEARAWLDDQIVLLRRQTEALEVEAVPWRGVDLASVDERRLWAIGFSVSVHRDVDGCKAFLAATEGPADPVTLYLRASVASCFSDDPVAAAALGALDAVATRNGWVGLRRAVRSLLAVSLALSGEGERAVELLDSLDEDATLDANLALQRVRCVVAAMAAMPDARSAAERLLRNAARSGLQVHVPGAWALAGLHAWRDGDAERLGELLQAVPAAVPEGIDGFLAAWASDAPDAVRLTGACAEVWRCWREGGDPTQLPGLHVLARLLAEGLPSSGNS